jgi:L-threonylcarbamoyladenylate synthase
VKQCRSKLNKWDNLLMEIINNPTQDQIKKAAAALKNGHLVAFPTETVYGLGADAENKKAVSRIYTVKGRPTDHPLIVHVSSLNQLDKWAIDIPEFAIELAKKFWPGPMTLILKRSKLAKNFITGGQDNVGIRIPALPIALELLSEFEKIGGEGIAAPSANRFGSVSPTTSIAVLEELGKYLGEYDSILNGGQCSIGIESTIIDCTNVLPLVIRPGATLINSAMISNSIKNGSNKFQNKIKAPGLLEKHYSPQARVLLNAKAESGDGFLAMKNLPTPVGAIRLASPESIEAYAKILYASFRSADHQKLNRIVVIPPDGNGLATAIRDRLNKAASSNSN